MKIVERLPGHPIFSLLTEPQTIIRGMILLEHDFRDIVVVFALCLQVPWANIKSLVPCRGQRVQQRAPGAHELDDSVRVHHKLCTVLRDVLLCSSP